MFIETGNKLFRQYVDSNIIVQETCYLEKVIFRNMLITNYIFVKVCQKLLYLVSMLPAIFWFQKHVA